MQGPFWHHHALAGQQLVHLHRGQALIEPRLDLLVMGHQQPPRLPTAVRPMRPDGLHHRPQELIGQLAVAAIADQAQPLRRRHVAADRLAIDPGQPLDRPQPLARQPQAQHLSNLEHGNLPEHRRPSMRLLTDGGESTGSSTAAGGPHRWSHYWRSGGPITGGRWSHPTGGTQRRVVPCRWRATRSERAEVVGDVRCGREVSGQPGECHCPFVLGWRKRPCSLVGPTPSVPPAARAGPTSTSTNRPAPSSQHTSTRSPLDTPEQPPDAARPASWRPRCKSCERGLFRITI